MKRAILLAAAAVLALSGIYAKAPVVINNDDYIVCSQQKIKKLNRKICRKFRRTYWKEQISHDSIYIYHFFSIYRQFRQTGTFFNDWKLLPTDNFAIHRLYASYAYDRDLNIIGEYDFCDFPYHLFDRPAVCVSECTHFPFADAVPKLAKLPILRLICNHVPNALQDEAGEEKFRQLTAGLPFPALLAHDGDEFSI